MPAHRKTLDGGYCAVEEDSEDARHENRGPRLSECEDTCTLPNLNAQRGEQAAEEVAHDAPIMARTVATFNPVKMNGSAFGIRTRRKISNSPAA